MYQQDGSMNQGGFGGGNGGFGGGAMPPRQMFDVSAMGLTCAECSTPITELPFEPKTDRPVYCKLHRPKKSFGGGFGGGNGGFGGGRGGYRN